MYGHGHVYGHLGAGRTLVRVTAVANAHGLRIYDLVLVRPGSLPRTTSGKVQRLRSRELYLANALKRLTYHPEHPLLGRYDPS